MEHVFKFICCGNVDDGKSTLIGRLLLDTNNVKKDQIEDALRASHKNGSKEMEPAMLLDGLLDEREQQITIDVAHRYFDYNNIRFHILDCPGHEQYTKNMAIAAAEADTAIIVIDATKGIKSQTLKHLEICDLFELKNILVCLTKTDLLPVNEKENILTSLKTKISQTLNNFRFAYQIIPVSAITGFNTDKVLKFLYETAKTHSQKTFEKTVLHILSGKLHQNKRFYYAKNYLKNTVSPNMCLTIFPQNRTVTVSDTYENGTFNIDDNIDISKGDCLSNTHVFVSNKIKHKTIWFDHPTPSMLFRQGTRTKKVVSFTPDFLELDDVIIFNNIDELKMNGFGIFIDEETKKTIGCAVFKNNQKEETAQKDFKTYIFIDNGIQSSEKLNQMIKEFSPKPIIIEEEKIKDIFFKEITVSEIEIQTKALTFSTYLNTLGQNVFYITKRLVTPLNSTQTIIHTGDFS